jgi:hypothetical protein
VACIVRAVCVGVFVTTKSGWYGIMVVIVYCARGGGDSVVFQTCVSVGASQAFKAVNLCCILAISCHADCD